MARFWDDQPIFIEQTGGASIIGNVWAGLNLGTRLEITAAYQTPAVDLSNTVGTARVTQTPAVSLNNRTDITAVESHPQTPAIDISNTVTTATVPQAPAFDLTAAASTATVTQTPGFDIEEEWATVMARSYSDDVTESLASDWDNIANAEGAPDAAVATLEEGLLLVQGTLICDFPDREDDLGDTTIEQVWIESHHRTAGINLLASGLEIQGLTQALPWSIEDLPNENHLTRPRIYDITSLLASNGGLTWANLDGLSIRYNGAILVDIGATVYEVDAVRLVVRASTKSFQPTDITGCVCWLDAGSNPHLFTDTTTADNVSVAADAVGRWEDRSGSGNHFTQATAGNRPTWNYTDRQRPYVEFAGTGTPQYLASTSSGFDLASQTVAVVFKADATPTTTKRIFERKRTTSIDVALSLIAPETPDGLMRSFYRTAGGQTTISTTDAAGTGAHVAIMRNSASVADMQIDGVEFTGTTGALVTSNFERIRIGSESASSPNSSFAFDGRVHEFIVFNSAISDADRDDLAEYLGRKWKVDMQ